MPEDYILRIDKVVKRFGNVTALENVSLNVRRGEIHVLCGENGAGKSTLMNIISGVYPQGTYEGNFYYNDRECRFRSIGDSEKEGIVIIHQHLALIPSLSIAENIYLGNEIRKGVSIDWNRTRQEAARFMGIVGLHESPDTLIQNIGVGKQQLVEICKAISKNVKLLILDEPTAALNDEESDTLLNLIQEFKEQGITSILISHKLREVTKVCDAITIIRDGETIETLYKGVDEITEARIIKGMVGRELTNRFPARDSAIGGVSLEIRNWNVYDPVIAGKQILHDISMYVRKGEVLGIAGLMGAGRTELAMSIFGRSYGTNITGRLFLHGKEVTLHSVRDAIRHKLAYVTEDRKGNGLILSNSVRTNTTLANMDAVSSKTIIDKDKEYLVAEEYRDKLKTKCPSVEQNVGNLSGGNQQKVLLAKWMFAEPDILILDEPTRGIDVGAKYEIYCIINQLAAEGKSVIMISSELPEVLGMSDRIYIMNEGRMAGEVNAGEATQEYIMSCILKSDKGE